MDQLVQTDATPEETHMPRDKDAHCDIVYTHTHTHTRTSTSASGTSSPHDSRHCSSSMPWLINRVTSKFCAVGRDGNLTNHLLVISRISWRANGIRFRRASPYGQGGKRVLDGKACATGNIHTHTHRVQQQGATANAPVPTCVCLLVLLCGAREVRHPWPYIR